MSGFLQSNVEGAKWQAGNSARTISLSPFDSRPPILEPNLLLDFGTDLMNFTRPASLFTAQCHLIDDIFQSEPVAQCHVLRDMFAQGGRA